MATRDLVLAACAILPDAKDGAFNPQGSLTFNREDNVTICEAGERVVFLEAALASYYGIGPSYYGIGPAKKNIELPDFVYVEGMFRLHVLLAASGPALLTTSLTLSLMCTQDSAPTASS